MPFDVVVVGDFRFPGGTSVAIAHEIRALSSAGYSVALVHKQAGVLRADRAMHPQIAACIDAGQAVPISTEGVRGEIHCRLAVLHNPYVFLESDPAIAKVRAKHAVLVAHQPVLDANGAPYYDAETVNRTAYDLVGAEVTWAPISPILRRNMVDARLPFPVLEEDWTNVIFAADWAADRDAPVGPAPVIGRHSRPEWQKWPATREEMLAVYPEGEEFDVRLLGFGDAPRKIVGEPLPPNWTALAFDAMDPLEFLRGIDFFVYFHHDDWVEGFGRTIAEAAASGAVVILPHYLRATFAEAALYRDPADVLPTVRELYADWESYRLQSKLGQRLIDRHYGPRRYLDRIRRLIGAPETKDAEIARPLSIRTAPNGHDAPAAAPKTVPPMALDVIHLGDLRTARDAAWRIVNEARIEADCGYATGLLHVAANAPTRFAVIHPAVDELVREGVAVPVNPSSPLVRTKLLLIHQPINIWASVMEGRALRLPRIVADNVVAIYDGAGSEDLAKANALLRTLFAAELTWAATDAESHAALSSSDGIAAERNIWSPAIGFASDYKPGALLQSRPVVGCVWTGAPSISIEAAEAIGAFLGPESDVTVRLLDPPNVSRAGADSWPANFEIFSSREMNLRRFMGSLDAFAALPAELADGVPSELIAWAMTHGVPAILPDSLEGRFGSGSIYAGIGEVGRIAGDLHADQEKTAALAARAGGAARQEFSPSLHRSRLRRFAGPPSKPDAKAPAVSRRRRRMLFMSSNGVGLGHLTRLLAIARRMPGDVEPVFATMSSAMRIVEQAGYPVEFLPFHTYANCDVADWNAWLAEQVAEIVEFHDPSAVVFDGNMPYRGLIQAVGARSDVKLVWVRRGMWMDFQRGDEPIARQRFFDLVVEPGDIAGGRDRGATARNRSGALLVPPIRLLDETELYDRQEAATRLGLDPARPAVLIQLGADWNRDVTTFVDAILQALTGWPELQPVLVDWLISGGTLDFWPGVPRLSGFPVAKYFNAFDFTITASGYNSFNEVISFGLPAIFIANEHPMTDDQIGRASFAEENGAALRLPESELHSIGRLLEAIRDEKIRWLMKTNCLRIAQPNGAAQAADAIAALVG
jgi:hypothetical protein